MVLCGRYEVCVVLWGYCAADSCGVWCVSDGPHEVWVLGLQTTLPLCCHFWTSSMGRRCREERFFPITTIIIVPSVWLRALVGFLVWYETAVLERKQSLIQFLYWGYFMTNASCLGRKGRQVLGLLSSSSGWGFKAQASVGTSSGAKESRRG